jgi:hypothetical protein
MTEPDWAQCLAYDIWTRPLPPARTSRPKEEDSSIMQEVLDTLFMTWRLIKAKRRVYFKLKQV